MIGTTTALILGGIMAGSSVASAAIRSRGAKGAAQIQSDAASRAAELSLQTGREAAAYGQQQWTAAQQRSQPYVQLGEQAYSTLGGMLGLAPSGHATPPSAVPIGPATHTLRGRGYAPATLGGPPATILERRERLRGPLTDAFETTAAPDVGTVQMQAPDGTVADVPVNLVAHYTARGARVLTR